MQKRAKRAEEELANIKKEQKVKEWEHEERLKDQKGILGERACYHEKLVKLKL